MISLPWLAVGTRRRAGTSTPFFFCCCSLCLRSNWWWATYLTENRQTKQVEAWKTAPRNGQEVLAAFEAIGKAIVALLPTILTTVASFDPTGISAGVALGCTALNTLTADLWGSSGTCTPALLLLLLVAVVRSCRVVTRICSSMFFCLVVENCRGPWHSYTCTVSFRDGPTPGIDPCPRQRAQRASRRCVKRATSRLSCDLLFHSGTLICYELCFSRVRFLSCCAHTCCVLLIFASIFHVAYSTTLARRTTARHVHFAHAAAACAKSCQNCLTWIGALVRLFVFLTFCSPLTVPAQCFNIAINFDEKNPGYRYASLYQHDFFSSCALRGCCRGSLMNRVCCLLAP